MPTHHTRLWTYSLTFALCLLAPFNLLASLGMGLSGFVGQIDGMSYAQFLAPGMIATTALFTAFFESSYGFYVRMTFESVFKAMLTTPIGVNEVVAGLAVAF